MKNRRYLNLLIVTATTPQVKQILKRGGASREFYISELVTHVISDEPAGGDGEGSAHDRAVSPLQGHDHVTVKVLRACPCADLGDDEMVCFFL